MWLFEKITFETESFVSDVEMQPIFFLQFFKSSDFFLLSSASYIFISVSKLFFRLGSYFFRFRLMAVIRYGWAWLKNDCGMMSDSVAMKAEIVWPSGNVGYMTHHLDWPQKCFITD